MNLLIWTSLGNVQRTRTGIRHGEEEGPLVLELEVLILKLFAVDALATSTVAVGEVTTLDHELLNDAVEIRAFVVERLSALAETLFAGAESAEVLSRLGHNIVVQLHNDASGLAVTNVNLKEDAAALRRSGGCLLGSHVCGCRMGVRENGCEVCGSLWSLRELCEEERRNTQGVEDAV